MCKVDSLGHIVKGLVVWECKVEFSLLPFSHWLFLNDGTKFVHSL